MHHWGEGAVLIKETANGFAVELTNYSTDAKVEVTLPLYGFFSQAERKLDLFTAEKIGNEFAHYLRDNFD